MKYLNIFYEKSKEKQLGIAWLRWNKKYNLEMPGQNKKALQKKVDIVMEMDTEYAWSVSHVC